MLTCMSGAVTALGDTVFPTQPALDASLLAPIQRRCLAQPALPGAPARSPSAGGRLRRPARRRRAPIVTGRAPAAPAQYQLATLAFSAVILQTGVGFVNVLLAAPGWLQIVHLAMAQAVWISTWLVWLAARRR